MLYCTGFDTLLAGEHARRYQDLLNRIGRHAGVVILAGSQAWRPAADPTRTIQAIRFPAIDFWQRRAYLQTCLAASGIALAASELEALAGRLQLTPEQISGTVAGAVNLARWRGALTATRPDETPNSQPTLAELFAAARAQSDHHLHDLARKITPRYTWDDLVLPADELAQLQASTSARPRRTSRIFDEPPAPMPRCCSSTRPTRCSASAPNVKDAHDRYANIESHVSARGAAGGGFGFGGAGSRGQAGRGEHQEHRADGGVLRCRRRRDDRDVASAAGGTAGASENWANVE
jgi:hypothetical protein